MIILQTPDSWDICRGKTKLATSKEGSIVPIILISMVDTNAIVVDFREAKTNIQWKRQFIFTSGNDSALYQFSFPYSSGKFRLELPDFSATISRFGPVKLSTIQQPENDDIMARSKMTDLAIFQFK